MKKVLKISAIVLAFAIVLGALSVSAVSVKKHFDQLDAEKTLVAERSEGKISDVFHDQGYIYMSPTEPSVSDEVTIRLSTLKYNVTKAQLVYTADEGQTYEKMDMVYDGLTKNKCYDLWKATIPPKSQKYRYFFLVGNELSENENFYSTKGVTGYQPDTNSMFTVDPGFTTPEWSKGTSWYGINIGSFYNGDSLNDALGYVDDLSPNQHNRVPTQRNFFGGDLKGAMQKINYIKSLGINSVYLNPLWLSFSTAGYGTIDYYTINPQFGNEKDLMDFVKLCHDNGLKVMLDVVPNFVADYGNWYNSASYQAYPLVGAFESENSAFKDVFKFYLWPKKVIQTQFSSTSVDFSNELVKELFYKTKDSVILRYLNKETYNIDGWRFDTSSLIWGSKDSKKDITNDIKKYVKAVDKDILFLGENYSKNLAEEGLFDSHWNHKLAEAFRGFVSSENTITEFRDSANSFVATHPRPLAESMYIYFGNHDLDRISSIAKEQHQKDVALISLMTYVGSPSVWYGDETGSDTIERRVDAFNWDERTWDFDNYYLLKSLCELRNDYSSTIRHGALKWGEVDVGSLFGTYARMDENATCVVVLNNKGVFDTRNLRVDIFGLCDGDILTDYLTGQKYEVKDGQISANIIAGGTVFVTGGKTSSYRDKYEIKYSGKKRNDVVYSTSIETLTAVSTEGKGVLDAKKDEGTFVQTPLFGSFGISASAEIKMFSKAAITVSDDESPTGGFRYSAVFSGSTLNVYARTEKNSAAKLITTAKIKNGSTFGVVRNQNNEFYVETYDNGNRKTLDGSKVYIPMKEKVYTGFVNISGKAFFSKILIERKNKSDNAETFEDSTTNSAFTLSGAAKIKKGTLQTKVSKSINYSADMPLEDFTVKTVIKSGFESSENGYAGLYIGNLDGDAVFAGLIDNSIVLARIINGQIAVYGSELLDNKSDVTVQLQKTANFFTVVYKIGDGEWKQINTRIFSAYSAGKVGIVSENSKVKFDYITFGDAVNDGGDINTPITLKKYVEDENYTINTTIRNIRKWVIDGNKTTWDYVVGGIAQKSDSGSHTMYEKNLLTDFRAETTLIIGDGDGFAGMFIRGDKTNFSEDNGYIVKLYKSGNLVLSKNGEIIESANIENIPNTGVRVIVETVGDKLFVFAGEHKEVVFKVPDVLKKDGYFGFYTHNVAATFSNYALYRLDVNYSERSNNYIGQSWKYEAGCINVTAKNNEYASLAHKGAGFTNAAAFVHVSSVPNVKDTDEMATDTYAGIAFSSNEGMLIESDGLFFGISDDGKIVVIENGEKKTEAEIPDFKGEVNSLFVTANDGVYNAYVNNFDQPVITYNSENLNGGVVSIVAYNSKASFSHFYTEDLSNTVDINSTIIKSKASRFMGSGKFVENVTAGKYSIANLEHISGKTSTTVIPTGKYSDFTIKFGMKMDNSETGNSGISFGNNCRLTVSNAGAVKFSAPKTVNYEILSTVEEIDGFFGYNELETLQMKIVKSGRNIKLFINDKLSFEAVVETDKANVALYTVNVATKFTNINITP